jgi:hypothetical protein
LIRQSTSESTHTSDLGVGSERDGERLVTPERLAKRLDVFIATPYAWSDGIA